MKQVPGSSQQIPLSFNKYEPVDFRLFEPGRNGSALAHLESVFNRPDEKKVTYLWGQTGSGKSHLLQALCNRASSAELTPAYIPLKQADSLLPEMLEGLESLALVCLDDIDFIAGREDWELALFHLYNRLRDAGVPLLITALQSPKGSPIVLDDLRSRLTWDHVFHLLPLDDEECISALQRRAHSRGFELPADVSAYLIKRVSRDTHNLFSVLDKLDQASMIAKKKLTVPFVRELLGQD